MRSREWLIETRKNKGITQKVLSEATGIPLCYIQNIEQGKRGASAERWQIIEEYLLQGLESIDKISIVNTDKLIQELNNIKGSANKIIYMSFEIYNSMIVFTDVHTAKCECSIEYIQIKIKNALELLNHQKRILK